MPPKKQQKKTTKTKKPKQKTKNTVIDEKVEDTRPKFVDELDELNYELKKAQEYTNNGVSNLEIMEVVGKGRLWSHKNDKIGYEL
jgi:hypothetical protein